MGFSDVLTLVEDEAERRKLIGLIKKNNDHLLRLFDDIVSMSKLEARGGGELNTSTFGLASIFKELIAKLEPQIPDVYDHLGAAMRQGALGELWPAAKTREEMRKTYFVYKNK